jgi:hypothetical protein
MAIGQGSSNTDEGVVGFWGYGENMQLEAPTQVMDFRRADALDGVAQRGFHALNEALQYYEEQHGRYPDALTPESVGDALEVLRLVWPINPFSGAPTTRRTALGITATRAMGTTTRSRSRAGTTRSHPERRCPVKQGMLRRRTRWRRTWTT